MKEGYTRANAIAKACQDIILKEIRCVLDNG